MDTATVDIMNRGMRTLVEHLGDVEAEQFISVIMRERFDYTKWQRQYFDNMSDREIMDAAVNYAKNHPFGGKPKVVISKNDNTK